MLKFLKKLVGAHADFRELVLNGALIVDVRTPEEFKAGHIEGSVNFPVDKIGAQVEKFRKTGKPVITVCRSGARSAMARELLKQKGIEAFNGGAWDSLREKLK